MKKMIEGGVCRCGRPLPDVEGNEKPFQFCSTKCADDEHKERLLDRREYQ